MSLVGPFYKDIPQGPQGRYTKSFRFKLQLFYDTTSLTLWTGVEGSRRVSFYIKFCTTLIVITVKHGCHVWCQEMMLGSMFRTLREKLPHFTDCLSLMLYSLTLGLTFDLTQQKLLQWFTKSR